MKSKVIIIDDEPDLVLLLEHTLTNEGFEVRSALNGSEGLDLVREWLPQVVILDVMLPHIDGFDVCRILRSDERTKRIPILFVSALTEEQKILTALDLGGADYITKPFSPRVLAAKVKRLVESELSGDLSSGEGAPDGEGIVIDLGKFDVRFRKLSLGLTRMELRIVELLCRHPGIVFSREKIVELINGEGHTVTDRSIDVHIASIRKKLGEAASLIETVRGVGYRIDETFRVKFVEPKVSYADQTFGK